MSLKTLALSALLATGVASGATVVSTVAFEQPASLPQQASEQARVAHAARAAASSDPQATEDDDEGDGQGRAKEKRAAASAAPCPPGVQNHGKYVSTVAHAPRPSADPSTKGHRGRGREVSAAAKSDCGKKDKADKADKAERVEESDEPKASKSPKPAKSPKANKPSKSPKPKPSR
ncbi:MAG TPA: hypothetical protein VNA12_08315 [Mycobacteriales bacterium]|nr:hypothetical protein [Mycobacteriales bacterium]